MTVLAPVMNLLLGVCLVRCGAGLERWTRGRLTMDAGVAVILAVLSAGHAGVLLRDRGALDWRIDGPAVHPQLRTTLERIQSKWGFSKEWLQSSAFVRAGFGSGEVGPVEVVDQRYSHLFDAFWRLTGTEARWAPPDKVLLLALPDSGFEREIEERQVLLDSLQAGVFNAYLCRRSAEHVFSAEPYCQFVQFVGPETLLVSRTEVLRDVEVEGKSYPLLASNVRPPRELEAEILLGLVLEKEGLDLLVGFSLAGAQMGERFRAGDNDTFEGAHAELRFATRPPVRLEIQAARFRETADRRALTAWRRLEGWHAEELEDVLCGVDAYLDLSHYAEPRSVQWSILPARPGARGR